MKKLLRILIGVGALVAMVTSAVPVGANGSDGPVSPSAVDETLLPGESIEVEKYVTTPEIPALIDICLLEDETGSFGDDISNLKSLAPNLVTALDASGSDYATCVLGFRDFAQDGWGSPGDWVYRRISDVASGGGSLTAGVAELLAAGGNDGPEAQLEALHYLAESAHPAIDSNGDGDSIDEVDTAAGMQPTWRTGAQRVVLLATDAGCHVTGDAGGWPGDAGTTNAATTAGILASEGITVIGLTPGGSGISCVDTLASETGGSVQATTASGLDIVEAILAGLEALTTDVWWEVDSDPELSVSLNPAVREEVAGGSTVSFTETISVDEMAAPGEYSATVTFYANSYPDEGEEIGRQSITITVPAVPFDVRPRSCRNPLNAKGGGVLPAALLGTAEFDVSSVDPASLEILGVAPLRWAYDDVATPFDPYTGKSDPFDCTDEGPDGFTDLTLKFDKKELLGAIEAEFGPLTDGQVIVLEITGELLDGRGILGEDVVVILEKGKPE